MDGEGVSTPQQKGLARLYGDRSPDSDLDSPDIKRSNDWKTELNRILTDRFDDLKADLKSENAELKKEIAVLREEIHRKDTTIATLEANLHSCQSDLTNIRRDLAFSIDKIEDLKLPIDELEQYSRRVSLRISGLGPLKAAQDYKDIVVKLAADMNSDVSLRDIDRAHPVGKDASQHLIVRFASYTARERFFSCRKLLKDKPTRRHVYINEDLTKRRHMMLQRLLLLRKDRKVDNAWSKDGRLFIWMKGRKHLITNNLDIYNIA